MTLAEYMDTIVSSENREKFLTIIDWVKEEFPQLELLFKWNQPMFLDHGTFIVGFSHAKNHISIAPEKEVLDHFTNDIKKQYTYSKKLFHIKWAQEVDYVLLKNIIQHSIELKRNYDKFWL